MVNYPTSFLKRYEKPALTRIIKQWAKDYAKTILKCCY
ncbi:hypothetical protein BN19_090 [Streptococcus phage SP-QS1]|uniref:Uncharacterized protein n=1 Tax=Streptococcus phage SP-QS1 TaxID=1208587 RepID=S6CR21_9CAUD|nr:hypothetical protein BN19_090 [Streptococcus phage SP-QS1]CCJ09743.1 hypothetical protein BN19_090 [Streptococcus phage SP-QS1]